MPRRKPGTLLPIELQILDTGLVLQRESGDFYGFGLAKAMHDSDGGSLTAHGTLYKALARLVAAGLLEQRWEDAHAAEAAGRPRRRLYRVTGVGATALAAQRTRTDSSDERDRGIAAATGGLA